VLPPAPPAPEEEIYDDITLLGRDRAYDDDRLGVVMTRMRKVSSSNVYGYYFEREAGSRNPNAGILYVTFLGGEADDRSGPGPTYAYYDVPVSKWRQFDAAADASAGGAVWDYLRVRGSAWQHQQRYRLIQVEGDYIPRKATRFGYKTRNLTSGGVGRRSFRRSTRAPQEYAWVRNARRQGQDPRNIDRGDNAGPDRGD
jgi:hypothetical protein